MACRTFRSRRRPSGRARVAIVHTSIRPEGEVAQGAPPAKSSWRMVRCSLPRATAVANQCRRSRQPAGSRTSPHRTMAGTSRTLAARAIFLIHRDDLLIGVRLRISHHLLMVATDHVRTRQVGRHGRQSQPQSEQHGNEGANDAHDTLLSLGGETVNSRCRIRLALC